MNKPVKKSNFVICEETNNVETSKTNPMAI